jgi:hypothetical protein
VSTETKTERRTWDLLTRDFYWQVPDDFAVKVFGSSDKTQGRTRLQVFEVAVAAIFARLRPDYEWYVTPNRPDGGLDFVGRQRFLEDQALGIAAAITVGGQCKKRTTVNDVVAEVAGSLARMAVTLNPTFFGVALSARLERRRVDQARVIIERTHQRHCHILDRRQIEGLMRENMGVVTEILREGLSTIEVGEVLAYFQAGGDLASVEAVDVSVPERVLAGVPFSATVRVRSSLAASDATRLWWRAARASDDGPIVGLIGPVGADGPLGVGLAAPGQSEELVSARRSIQLVSYSVGDVDLGEILVGRQADVDAGVGTRISLGVVRVIENVHPRFFERPFRGAIARLDHEYDRALASGAASIAVVGTGGSGKSRLSEEFAFEKLAHGSDVVAAKQAKTLDDPHRLLAELFVALASEASTAAEPVDRALAAVSQYDSELALRAEPAIRSIFGSNVQSSGPATDQALLSAILLLVVARGRRSPIIVHLQDLHWCSADVLLLLERLVWQIGLVLGASGSGDRRPESGVLFVFEGRLRERQDRRDEEWTSEPFEAFLGKLGCPTVKCASFGPEDALEFTRRLFEDRYSARRLLAPELLELQGGLIEQINRTAGGNPFHSIEQLQLLRDRRVVGQNPQTGLLYMIQPAPTEPMLPDSVFESIRLRWQYLRGRAPDLALLLWAAALIEDRVPAGLFRYLSSELAPEVSMRDVDATEVLWTGDGEARDVVFRHENYFQSLRLLQVSPRDRTRIVDVYCDWFERLTNPTPADRFRWARALLERPEPDNAKARHLLATALRAARRGGDPRLARRIWAAALDLGWSTDDVSGVADAIFLRRCDDELTFARDLLGSDLHQAAQRLDSLRHRISRRVSDGRAHRSVTLRRLRWCELTADMLRSRILFNDRRPAAALDVASRVVRGVAELRRSGSPGDIALLVLEMEALHSQAVALALSGEIDEALQTSEHAVDIAGRLPSELSLSVVATYANILLARDPIAAELMLREQLADSDTAPVGIEARNLIEITLSMALVVQSHGPGADQAQAHVMLTEAASRLADVYHGSFRIGAYPDAGAAALMLGIVSVLTRTNDAAPWFAQAVAAAARGRQIETLWRAHINLASALYASERRVTPSVRDHAKAAFEIMEDSLSSYAEADRSARFALIVVPLTQAVRFLVLAGEDDGRRALEKYPALRRCFRDPTSGELLDDRGGYLSHEWIRDGDEDYVIY